MPVSRIRRLTGFLFFTSRGCLALRYKPAARMDSGPFHVPPAVCIGNCLRLREPSGTHIQGQTLAQSVDECRAVLVEKRDKGDGSFLRVAVGEGKCACVHELAPQGLVAPLCGLDELAVQAFDLFLHPAERRPGSALEGRVDSGDGLDHRRHLHLDGPRGSRQRFIHRRGDLALEQLVQRRFVLRLQCFEGKLVFRQEADRLRIKYRRRRAGAHQGHRHAEVLVDASKLSQIGQFVGSSHVTDCREQGVLDNRSQQDARTEGGWPVAGFLSQHRRGVDRVPHDKLPVLVADGPAPTPKMEEGQTIVLRMDLRVVSPRDEGRPGRRCQAGGPSRRRQLAAKHLGDQRLGRRVRRVVDDEPAIAEDSFEPPTERLGHADAGRIRIAELFEK